MKRGVVLVAGGTGNRFGGDVPKQFMLLGGKPVIILAAEAFVAFDPEIEMVMVLPAAQISYWRELTAQFGFTHPHQVIEGGSERYYSVRAGLAAIQDASLVGIHDAVRPLVTQATIAETYKVAEIEGAAVPVVVPVESMRELDGDASIAVNREVYRIVQTPQVFKKELLEGAYDGPFHSDYTDDATVAEKKGARVYLVKGNRENIKITNPEDFFVAEAYYKYLHQAES